jgi:hypothetical protein
MRKKLKRVNCSTTFKHKSNFFSISSSFFWTLQKPSNFTFSFLQILSLYLLAPKAWWNSYLSIHKPWRHPRQCAKFVLSPRFIEFKSDLSISPTCNRAVNRVRSLRRNHLIVNVATCHCGRAFIVLWPPVAASTVNPKQSGWRRFHSPPQNCSDI